MSLSRYRAVPIALAAFTLLFASIASAAFVVRVNGTGSGIFTFDQPSVLVSGWVAHVAFIGDAAGDNTFKLYYTAVNGRSDFQKATVTQSDILLTPAVAIDNGSRYTGARHPQIALQTSGRLIVLFQAVPTRTGATGVYKLFRAVINLSGNAVTSQIVDEITDPSGGEMAGTLVDPSFAVATSDTTLRISYTDNSTQYKNVYFARVAIDNAAIVGGPLLLSSSASSLGVQPLSRLKLDEDGHSHVVWAANDNTGNPTPIYYSFVKRNSSGAPDNVGIGPTPVLQGNYPYGFPNLALDTKRNLYVFGVDQKNVDAYGAGILAFTLLDPYGVTHNGGTVTSDDTDFFLTPPGEIPLSTAFNTYHPEITMDTSDYFHVAGYGYYDPASSSHGVSSNYYAMWLGDLIRNNSEGSVPTLELTPMRVGTVVESFGMQIPGDYTRAAFAHFEGKALHFWSGPDSDNVLSGASNLYVTSTIDTTYYSNESSGCSVAAGRRSGGAFPAATLLLPIAAILFLLRKPIRKALARR